MRPCAPIALFAYNRPDHTRRTVEALRANLLARDSHLIIFCDAAPTQQAEAAVAEVRAYARTVDGFRLVEIVERPHNMGLAASIVDGVTRICSAHGRIIVLEDDLVTSAHFLTYMNDALDVYADDERVISIHGYTFPVGRDLPETFFLRDPGCWGWATWARGWGLMEQDGARFLAEVKRQKREREFNLDGSYNYLGMLEARIHGRNSSWAILWYASAFLKGKLTLYPGRSLVQNVGNDGSGTHRGNVTNFVTVLSDTPVAVGGIAVEEDRQARAWLAAYLMSLQSPRIRSWLRRLATRPRGP